MSEQDESFGSKNLVHVAIQNPFLVIAACLLVIILGLLSLFTLPKDLLPAANLPAVQILFFFILVCRCKMWKKI